MGGIGGGATGGGLNAGGEGVGVERAVGQLMGKCEREWLRAMGAAGSKQKGPKSQRSVGCVRLWDLKDKNNEEPMGSHAPVA